MINISLNIEEGITTSPCSYTRNMGSTAKNVIIKKISNYLSGLVTLPAKPHLNDYVRKAVGRGDQAGDLK